MIHAILTCSPYFTDSALNEIRRCQPQTTVCQHLAPGHLIVQALCSFDELTHPWHHRLPIYLHHLFPIHTVLPLEATQHDLPELKQAALRIAPSDVVVQVRSTLETGLPYSPIEIQQFLNGRQVVSNVREPTGRVLSILIVQEQVGLRAYMGVSWAAQNLSPWPGGQIPITEPVSNRAGYKLLEALEVFSIRLRKGDHALDLGAAPGRGQLYCVAADCA